MNREKPKALPSSLRESTRYLVFEVLTEKEIKWSELIKAFWRSFIDLFGSIGTSKVRPWFMKEFWNPEPQRGILRCRSKYLAEARTALALIKRVDGKEVIPRTIGVSGTLKKAKRFL